LTDFRDLVIPQDPLLFSGTLRTNLDPFSRHDDASLWSALRAAGLVDRPVAVQEISVDKEDVPSGVQTPVNRFSLDMVIEEEGGNLSVGQRSLVSLARALVKDSKIIVLDEGKPSFPDICSSNTTISSSYCVCGLRDRQEYSRHHISRVCGQDVAVHCP
jgi:ABC-type transport system involved in cytochrome bd biosynthesis fused ATPase/permease subunit